MRKREDVREEMLEDIEDLERARRPDHDGLREDRWWKRLGPGIITGAADDDPSGIGTYSVAGAQFGYSLLWLVPFCLPLMIVVQEMSARIATITGKGLAAALKDYYPAWLLWGAVLLTVVANTFNVYADFNVIAASARMLLGGPLWFWLTLLMALTLCLQIRVPYRSYVKYLKWMCLALLAYVVTDLWPGVRNDWAAIGSNLVTPHWSRSPAFVLTVVGFLGTTISPYCFFWQAGETVEEEIERGEEAEPGFRLVAPGKTEMRAFRLDTAIGMVISQTITFFIIICTAAVLHARGVTDLETANDAARALSPLGPAASAVFTLGVLGVGLLAIPTLTGSAAYSLAETLGWPYGLYRRFRRARAFYAAIAGVTLIGWALNFVRSISPVRALLYSAVLNGVAAPPLIVLLLLICNNRRIVGTYRNSLLTNLVGGVSVLAMGGAAATMLWQLLAP